MNKGQISIALLISLILILSIFTIFLTKLKDLNKLNVELEQRNNKEIIKINSIENSFNVKKINNINQPYILEQDIYYENHYE